MSCYRGAGVSDAHRPLRLSLMRRFVYILGQLPIGQKPYPSPFAVLDKEDVTSAYVSMDDATTVSSLVG